MMSSFSMRSEPSRPESLRRRALAATAARTTLASPCSNPAWCVPPWGVAITLTKVRTTVS